MSDTISLNTPIDRTLIQTELTITQVYSNTNPYLYKTLTSTNQLYLLKGYRIPLENSNEGKDNLMKLIRELSEINSEYNFYKIASIFNLHFVKALGIEYSLTSSHLFVEILFEHPGDKLSFTDELDSDRIYELMKQSADVLSFIQSAGMEWSVDNVFFDKTTNLLKVVKSHTRNDGCFIPPEVLRGETRNSVSDVYCWAMSLYSLVLNKTEDNFKYKALDKVNHEKFIDSLKADMRALKGDELKRNLVIEEMVKALSYNPQERPTSTQIRNRMQEFSGSDSLETKHKQKLIELLAIKDKVKNSCVIEANEAEVNNLMNLGDSMLKYLKGKKREYEVISNSLIKIRKLPE